jgi:tetratricopeptide (TPR) repeat protein
MDPAKLGDVHLRAPELADPLLNGYLDACRGGGDPRLAIEIATVSLARSPPVADRARLLRTRGVAQRDLGSLAAALVDLDASIQLEPSSYRGRVDRSDVLVLLARIEKDHARAHELLQRARDDADQALELDKDDPAALRHRGEARFELGDFEGARTDIEKAVSRDPNADNHEARGDVRSGLGDIPGAIADYRRALELLADKDPKRCLTIRLRIEALEKRR